MKYTVRWEGNITSFFVSEMINQTGIILGINYHKNGVLSYSWKVSLFARKLKRLGEMSAFNSNVTTRFLSILMVICYAPHYEQIVCNGN